MESIIREKQRRSGQKNEIKENEVTTDITETSGEWMHHACVDYNGFMDYIIGFYTTDFPG